MRAARRVNSESRPIGIERTDAQHDDLGLTFRHDDDGTAVVSMRRALVYDCLYIALAARDAAPLVTADATLARRVRNTPWETLVELLGGQPQA